MSAASVKTDSDALPDPTARGPYKPMTVEETKLGLADLEEPNSAGAAPTPGTAQAREHLEIRGALYYPDDGSTDAADGYQPRTTPSPVIVFVHGNHGSCDQGQNSTTATCAVYKHNESGYAYLGENLASWGYTVFSLSQDQLMMRQDNNMGKGMHNRRMLIAQALDALSAANKPGGLPVDDHTTIGTTLSGRLDMTRIGLMGHSRGGDVVSSFIDYDRIRTDGPRYPIRAVLAIAPVDYERKAPYGVPYMTILPMCDGDVSNLQGARMFERSQYVDGNDPFPKIQVEHQGAIHNWYNTVWYADGGADGQNNNDAACGNSTPFATSNVHPHNLRLSGAADYGDPEKNYAIDDNHLLDPNQDTKISGDPARMGDQEKLGLATGAAFLRRYVGGEGAFQPYMTGELSNTATHQQVPTDACPTSESGTRIPCYDRVSTTYFAPSSERVDLIRPEIENPLTMDALGGTLSGSGFANPYAQAAGVSPTPPTTSEGYDWCNPEPKDFAPAQLGKSGLPTAAKPCPLPAASALGGQNGIRENGPVNQSYGRQLSLAWEPGQVAKLDAQIPAADSNLTGLKALSIDAAVNFFDSRNPGADQRGDSNRVTAPDGTVTYPNEGPTSYNPMSTTQDFIIALTDSEGHTGTVHADDPRWGNALHMSTGTFTANTHIVLDQLRIPLDVFAAQGIDISSLSNLELRFGEAGTPPSGSIQVADVRFQEAVDPSNILSDGDRANGAGYGPVSSGPNPEQVLSSYDNSPGEVKLGDQVGNPWNDTVWTVDDDKQQCPNANTTSIQQAVDFAAPWDTIVICPGVYQESSTPSTSASSPATAGSRNGLTINKPLKIKGAGADKVTIEPDQSQATLAGSTPYLRDGGGNVITVSRQSLGSTDTNEMFVDISGVTVTAGNTWAEAGVAYFGAAGRISDSVIGPMKVATTPDEVAAHPHGWGIVKTGVIQGAGPATVESELTVTNSVVKGYQSGGIFFDGARGPDGSADNTVRTGIRYHGYVTNTVVKGDSSSLFPQVGVKYSSGVDGFIDTSRITDNYFAPDPDSSAGILLTDAGTDTTQGVSGTADILTGNGYAVDNANAENTGVREGAPVTLKRAYLGTGDPSLSGPDSSGSPTVTITARSPHPIQGVPTGATPPVADAPPSAQLIDPGHGRSVNVGDTLHPLARALDDLAVTSATLVVDGHPVATIGTAPYVFTWTPGASLRGTTVKLQTRVTDSSGQQSTSAPVTVHVAPTGGR